MWVTNHVSDSLTCLTELLHSYVESSGVSAVSVPSRRLLLRWSEASLFVRRLAWSWPSTSPWFPCTKGPVQECRMTVTEGHALSPHCESKPKLYFIRLLSLQRLSHHSINTPCLPPSKFVFPPFPCIWKCSRTVPALWCGFLFFTLVQQTTQ